MHDMDVLRSCAVRDLGFSGARFVDLRVHIMHKSTAVQQGRGSGPVNPQVGILSPSVEISGQNRMDMA